jgi:glycosyltransferase involved in cell wall biosynthesis
VTVSFASVVVPTRDRPTSLARCLAALLEQRDIELEVVVVDDGSADPAAIERLVAADDHARLVRIGGRGPAAARNAGIREAAGEVVLLTDDDCVAEPGWAASLAAAVVRTAALAAGRTLHDPGRPLVAASETIVAHAERADSFAATRNVGAYRSLALAIPFDERFREAGGEDREWCRRLAEAGTHVVRAEDAVVFHRPELDLRAFWRQHVRYGRAARADGRRPRRPLRSHGQLLVAGFRRGPVTGGLVVLAQVATLRGYSRRWHR